ncbi:MAG: hypothetical protein ABIK36_07685 [Pseudomonadota bacterium]|jgi:hypothetical protein
MRSIAGRLFFVGALLGAGATAAAAQANHFRGSACIQTVTAGCAAVGVTRGMCYDSRLRPPNYNGGPNSTRISFFLPYFANNFTLPTGTLLGTTFKQVNATGLGQSVTGFTARARIPAMTPAAPAPATVYVSATVDINGFDSDAPTCNVRLYFQGQRYPL